MKTVLILGLAATLLAPFGTSAQSPTGLKIELGATYRLKVRTIPDQLFFLRLASADGLASASWSGTGVHDGPAEVSLYFRPMAPASIAGQSLVMSRAGATLIDVELVSPAVIQQKRSPFRKAPAGIEKRKPKEQ
jgi:hypothetical protein